MLRILILKVRVFPELKILFFGRVTLKVKGVVSKTTSKHLFVVRLQDPPLPQIGEVPEFGKRTRLESEW